MKTTDAYAVFNSLLGGDFPLQAPEVVARHVLGVPNGAPLRIPAIKALFRHRLQYLRPDLLDGETVAPELEVLIWARDDLVRRAEGLEAERIYRQTVRTVTDSGAAIRNGPAWLHRRCQGCEAEFSIAGGRRDRRYCSSACRQRAYRKRRSLGWVVAR